MLAIDSNLVARYRDGDHPDRRFAQTLDRRGAAKVQRPGPERVKRLDFLNNKDMAVMSSINLNEKLASFSDHWAPKIVERFNGHDVMLVKVNGQFVWHSHEDTDDFFLVLKGRLTIQLRDRNIELGPGELYVVPKGVEHRPVATEETHLLLIEPHGEPNTGDASTATTKEAI